MHQPPRLLMFAAACGATLGATAAWRIASARWALASKPAVTAPISASVRSVHRTADARAPEGIATALSRATTSASDSVSITEAVASNVQGEASNRPLIETNPSPAASASATSASSVLAPTLAAEPPAYQEVSWGTSADRQEDDRLCVAGAPEACLRLAEAEAIHLSSAHELERSRAHRERAYSILVFQCNRRNPDACVTIARMHSLGVGVARDPVSERALLARAAILCKKLSGKVCELLGP